MRGRKEGKEKSNDMPHLAGLCLKPLNHWKYLNKPLAMSTGSHTEQMHWPKLDFSTGVKYIDSTMRTTMRTPLPCDSLFIDLNYIWFRQMFNKCSIALEIGHSNIEHKDKKRYSNVLLVNSVNKHQMEYANYLQKYCPLIINFPLYL